MWCVSCGNRLAEGLRFCTNCGRAVSPDAAAAPPPHGAPSNNEPVLGAATPEARPTSPSPLLNPPSGDPTGGMPAPAASTSRRWKPVAVGLGAVAIVGIAVALMTRSDGGNDLSNVPSALSGDPEEFSSFDVEGDAFAIASAGKNIVFRVLGDVGTSELVAHDIATGKRVWRKDATDWALDDNYLYLLDGDELARVGADGKSVGKPIRLDNDEYEVRIGGNLVVSLGDDDGVLVNTDSWKVIARGTFAVSGKGSTVFEIDTAGDSGTVRARALDTASGKPIGDRFEFKGPDDYVALDNGTMAVLEDDDIRLYDRNGADLGRVSGPRGAYRLAARGDLVAAVDGNESATIYRVEGDQLQELSGEVDSFGYFLPVNGTTWIVASDDRTTIHQVDGTSIEEVFDFRGDIYSVVSSGFYSLYKDEIEYYALPGDGQSKWNLDVPDNASFRAIEGGLVTTEYDSDNDETTATVYR